MLTLAELEFVDLVWRVLLQSVSLIITVWIALHTVRRSDAREREKRGREELITFGYEFLDTAHEIEQKLRNGYAAVQRCQEPEPTEKINKHLNDLVWECGTKMVRMSNKLDLIGRHELAKAVTHYSLQTKSAQEKILSFSMKTNVPEERSETFQIVFGLADIQSQCSELFQATIKRDEENLSAGCWTRTRRGIGALVNRLKGHFGLD